MDTAHSSNESKKVPLTFFLKREKLFLAFLMDHCTKGAICMVFDRMEKKLGTYDFLYLFHTILTDRSYEFGDPVSLENDIHGIERTNIYYCDSMHSDQKGSVKNVHSCSRWYFPKSQVLHSLHSGM